MTGREVFSDNGVEFSSVDGRRYAVKGDKVYMIFDYSNHFVLGEIVEDKKIIAEVRGNSITNISSAYRGLNSLREARGREAFAERANNTGVVPPKFIYARAERNEHLLELGILDRGHPLAK